MRFVSMASGSSGNSSYVASDNTHILVDVGISNKKIEAGLADIGIKAGELSGLLITHEHIDHIKGLKTFIKKHQIPIYTSKGTAEFLIKSNYISGYEDMINVIQANARFRLGDIEVLPFDISHDAAEPLAFRLSSGSKSIAIATDLGYYDDYIVEKLKNLDVLLIEANHDIRMLECGPYPYHLKRRILGNKGHLSNENAGRLLCKVLHDGVKNIFLGHLSSENNYPSLAYEAVRYEITEDEGDYKADDFYIEVAKRDGLSCVCEF